MVKVKSNKSRGINFKRYFIILGSLVSVLALVVLLASAQKSTNVQSNASGSCNKFSLQNTGINSYASYMGYDLKVKNNCNEFMSFWITATPPNKVYRDPGTGEIENWKVLFFDINGKFINQGYDTVQYLKSGNVYKDELKVYPPAHAPKGTYNIKVKACEYTPNEMHSDRYITNNCSPILNLKYIKN